MVAIARHLERERDLAPYTHTCKLAAVKKRDLAAALGAAGWWFLREGGSHEVWTNGVDTLTVPRHREVNELTAAGILRRARNNPPAVPGRGRKP